MTHKQVEEYILSMPNAKLDYPFGEDVAVYKVFVSSAKPIAMQDEGVQGKAMRGEWKMFALVQENKEPVRLSLKGDPKLSEVLREKYESVMPGYHLNKKHWNTIVLTGQLPWEDVKGLIRHSYDLVVGKAAI